MKNPQSKHSMLAIVLGASVLSLGAAAAQAQQPPPGAGSMHHERGRHPGGMMLDPFMMAVQQLNPTVEQQARFKSLMEAARQQFQPQLPGDGSMLLALGNPGDPGYPAAVQDAKSKAGAMIQARSDLDVQIYAMLTDEQKAKLPQVLADMQARFSQQREAWHHK